MTPSSPQNYLVSAIVSTYNAERFIRGKLEDLEAQSIADRLEIIVIDSGSQQNERDVVEEFQTRYSNIQYIRTEQRETIYQAWNRGITLASGEFICNANTDDRLRCDALEVLLDTLTGNPEVALAYSDILYTTEENATFANFPLSGQIRFPAYKPFELLEGCNIQTAPLWRKSLHDDFGYFDERYRSAADYEFWLRISKRYDMRHVNQFLVLCLQRAASISKSQLASFEFFQIQQTYRQRFAHLLPKPQELAPNDLKLFHFVTSQEIKPSTRATFLCCFPDFAPVHHMLGEYYFQVENMVLARRHFEKALILDPFCLAYQDSLSGLMRLQFFPLLQQIVLKILDNPHDLESRLCAGMLCILLGRFEQAKIYYRQAALIAPENILPRANLQALEQADQAVDR